MKGFGARVGRCDSMPHCLSLLTLDWPRIYYREQSHFGRELDWMIPSVFS